MVGVGVGVGVWWVGRGERRGIGRGVGVVGGKRIEERNRERSGRRRGDGRSMYVGVGVRGGWKRYM